MLTPKQEKFAQLYIETGNASEAYRQAYSTKGKSENYIHVNACKVLGNAKVTLRVKELKAKHEKRHDITVDHLLAELEEARQLAAQTAQTSSMVAATMGKAKMLGLDKKVIEVEQKALQINIIDAG